MRPYRAFFRADGRSPAMVAQGLSWRVLVFGWVGLLSYGAWISALLAGAASLVLGMIAPLPISLGLHACLHLGLAAFTAEIRAWEWRLNGAVAGPVVAGSGPRAALLRLIDTHPGILARAVPAAGPPDASAGARPVPVA